MTSFTTYPPSTRHMLVAEWDFEVCLFFLGNLAATELGHTTQGPAELSIVTARGFKNQLHCVK